MAPAVSWDPEAAPALSEADTPSKACGTGRHQATFSGGSRGKWRDGLTVLLKYYLRPCLHVLEAMDKLLGFPPFLLGTLEVVS